MNIKYYFVKLVAVGASMAAAIMIMCLPIAAAYKMVSYAVPDGDTSFKTYMGYQAITNTNSAQYKLQQKATTDEHGLRQVDDYYIVALGSFYTESIGDKFVVELDTGVRIKVIVGDFKADKHTDNTNRYIDIYDNNGNFISHNVIEFIVDTATLDKTAKNWGDISAIDGFEGNISAIYKLEEIAYEKE